MIIFDSPDNRAWHSACAAYNAALHHAAEKKPDIFKNAVWAYCELPIAIGTRSPPQLFRSELSKLMTFKLQIGKWRPRLQQFVDEAKEEDVRSASLKSFALAAAGKTKEALEALCVLKGVGPATASLILSVYSPDFPFLSDEASEEVLGSRDYTLAEAVTLTNKLREKAEQLNKSEHLFASCAQSSTIDTGAARGTGAGVAGAGEKDKAAPSLSAQHDPTAPPRSTVDVWTAKKVEMAIFGAVRAAKGLASAGQLAAAAGSSTGKRGGGKRGATDVEEDGNGASPKKERR